MHRKQVDVPNGFREDLSIGVLLVTGKKELADILYLLDLLTDMRVILVLPESDYDMNSMAHILRPRFLTYINSDFKEVKAVLRKMLQGINVGQIEEKP